MEQITLYYRQGASDKVYQARIAAEGDGYVVRFAYGRRGSTLQTGAKTQTPVSSQEAKQIYTRLVAEKTAKGYTTGEAGTPYVESAQARQVSGILPQLLNPVGDDAVEHYIGSPAYWMQEKYDGRRLLIRKQGTTITGINRLGLAVALPASLVKSESIYRGDFIIDGEAIGDDLYAFDALSIGDEDIRKLGFGERYLKLLNLLASFQHPHMHLVETAFQPGQKTKMFERLKEQGREGAVFKHVYAPYVSGRPASGGAQLKIKFCETASFIVTRVNAKRSVALMLFCGDKIVPAGNVTIPANHDVPAVGRVVECRYLYAFRESGCIYQPVFLGVREDIRAEECTTAQLKYKVEQPAAAA